MSRWRTRASRAVLALLVAVVAAGCVSIPDSSSIQQGRPPGAQEFRPPLRNIPAGPLPNGSREAIVTGYLRAMLAYPPAPRVVREFMTSPAAVSWNPDAGVKVYENPSATDAGSSVLVKGDTSGTLDARGSWTSAGENNRAFQLSLKLSKQHGQWRISNPPPGILIELSTFENVYRPFSLYFFDRTRPAHVLVPDPVFLLNGDSTATLLVNDLLQGPTRDLSGGVSSAAPPATQVDPSVSITTSGTVQVPLTDHFLSLSSSDRQLFAVQLTWTLKQLAQYLPYDLSHIVISVDGNPYNVPGIGSSIPIDSFQYYDPAGLATNRSLFALSGGRLVTVTQSGPIAAPGPIGKVPFAARSAAVAPSPSGNLAALVTAKGNEVYVGATELNQAPGVGLWLSHGSDFLRPSWDIHQMLWVVDETSKGAVLHVVAAATAKVVVAPGISGKDVTAIAVSRDGVRLAAIVRDKGGSHLVISTIRRDPEHPRDVSLGDALTISNPDFPLAQLSGLAWTSPTSVVVLAQEEGGEERPYEISIDGSTVNPSAGFIPIQPVSIAAAPNSDTRTVIGASDGRLYEGTPTGQWSRFGGSAKYQQPFYPG
ncbi:MAG: LpqB family beta-propeller domain-containing protein [Nocardioidaceae bacterium]